MAQTNSERYWAYIARKGVPKKVVNDMRLAVFEDAMQEAKLLMNERWYSIIAYMIATKHPERTNEEILEDVRSINHILNAISDNEMTWMQLDNWLYENRGFMVRDTVSEDGKEMIRHFVDIYDEEEKENGIVAKGVSKRD